VSEALNGIDEEAGRPAREGGGSAEEALRRSLKELADLKFALDE
jgi:hypothetical protein